MVNTVKMVKDVATDIQMWKEESSLFVERMLMLWQNKVYP